MRKAKVSPCILVRQSIKITKLFDWFYIRHGYNYQALNLRKVILVL